MKIVTAAEMREIDRVTTERFGVPSLTLMENAGAAVADFVISHYPAAKRIGVICGKGNNGGDGFVTARKLHEAGKHVQVLLLAEKSELRGDAAEMFSKLPMAPVIASTSELLKTGPARAVFDSELLVDAILGTGFRPPVSGLYAEAIAAMNASLCTGSRHRHSIRRRCRCHGRSSRRRSKGRCSCDFYRATSRSHLRNAHQRPDGNFANRITGRSHRFFSTTQCHYGARDCAADRSAASRV